MKEIGEAQTEGEKYKKKAAEDERNRLNVLRSYEIALKDAKKALENRMSILEKQQVRLRRENKELKGEGYNERNLPTPIDESTFVPVVSLGNFAVAPKGDTARKLVSTICGNARLESTNANILAVNAALAADNAALRKHEGGEVKRFRAPPPKAKRQNRTKGSNKTTVGDFANGYYDLPASFRRKKVRKVGDYYMVRIGGGYQRLTEFIKSHIKLKGNSAIERNRYLAEKVEDQIKSIERQNASEIVYELPLPCHYYSNKELKEKEAMFTDAGEHAEERQERRQEIEDALMQAKGDSLISILADSDPRVPWSRDAALGRRRKNSDALHTMHALDVAHQPLARVPSKENHLVDQVYLSYHGAQPGSFQKFDKNKCRVKDRIMRTHSSSDILSGSFGSRLSFDFDIVLARTRSSPAPHMGLAAAAGAGEDPMSPHTPATPAVLVNAAPELFHEAIFEEDEGEIEDLDAMPTDWTSEDEPF
mmetsp:Transcript_9489/g.24474  ORF Transcript_9489/g.24474 Transcript_9489/m.24474 type:complete len:478 (+) Transcript_9489:74-1507(+)